MDAAAQAQIDDTFSQIDLINLSPSGIGNTADVGDEIWVYAQRNRLNGADPDVALASTIVEWTSAPDTAVEFLEEQEYADVDDGGNDIVVFGVLVRFLEPGQIEIEGTGYSSEPRGDGVDGAMAYFAFDVASDDNTGDGNIETLSINQRTAQTNLIDACDANQVGNATDTGSIELQATCDAVAALDDPSAALDNIVPDELFSIGDMLVTTVDQQVDNIEARINAVRLGQDKAIDVSGLDLTLAGQQLPGTVLTEITNAAMLSGGGASDDGVASSFESSKFGLFINGNLSVGEYDGNDIQTDADFSTSVLTLGADYRLSSQRVIGAALSLESDNTDFKADDGELDMQGFGLSTFGTWYEQDKGYADVIFSISQNDFDIRRRINLPGNADEFAEGSSDATRFALAVNAGRTIQRGASEFGPLASINIMRASVGGFTETSTLAANGAGTALRVDSQSVTSVRVAVGGEFKHVINTRKAVFVPYTKLLLDFESQTDKDAITASFVNDVNATDMRFTGAKRDASSLLFSLGTTAVFTDSRSAFVTLETRLLDERVSQTQLQLGYRSQF